MPATVISATTNPQAEGAPLPSFVVLRVGEVPGRPGDGEDLGCSSVVGETAVACAAGARVSVGCDAGPESGVAVASEDPTSDPGMTVAATVDGSDIGTCVGAGGVAVGVSSPPLAAGVCVGVRVRVGV